MELVRTSGSVGSQRALLSASVKRQEREWGRSPRPTLPPFYDLTNAVATLGDTFGGKIANGVQHEVLEWVEAVFSVGA